MEIKVKVIPNAKSSEVVQEGKRLKVRVAAPASGGRANKEAAEALAGFFHVKKNAVKIIRGEKSGEKTVEIG